MKIEHNIFETTSLFDSESLVDKAYSGLVELMDFYKDSQKVISCKGHGKLNSKAFSTLFNDGLYLPGSKRNFWTGFVDPVDFPLPDSGSVWADGSLWFDGVEDRFHFITIKKIKSLPKKVIPKCKKPMFFYKVFVVFVPRNPIDSFSKAYVEESYFCISEKGNIYPTIDRLKIRQAQMAGIKFNGGVLILDNLFMDILVPGAISLLADRKYLWNVKTKEKISQKLDAILNFGVEEEMVKSLFFARDNPLTPTGRKKPILHWVQSHKRRLKEKIDIDVKKHLRGITSFNLGNLEFSITSPIK